VRSPPRAVGLDLLEQHDLVGARGDRQVRLHVVLRGVEYVHRTFRHGEVRDHHVERTFVGRVFGVARDDGVRERDERLRRFRRDVERLRKPRAALEREAKRLERREQLAELADDALVERLQGHETASAR
jgi:hypothetical protein